MSGNFRIRKPAAVFKHPILLIDDVVTSGATLNAASKTLRQAGVATVDALIFAKRL
jgi:predicted amidophosphoribosyltransferase